MAVISVYTYGVKIIKKFCWESGFLGGFHGTPLYNNGSAGYLMQLSVNGFKAYLTSKGMSLDFEEWENPRLAEVLSKFYVEVVRNAKIASFTRPDQ